MDYKQKYLDLVLKYNQLSKNSAQAIQTRDERLKKAIDNINIANKEILRLRGKLGYSGGSSIPQPRSRHGGALYTKRMHDQDMANKAMIDMNERDMKRSQKPSSGWWIIDKFTQ